MALSVSVIVICSNHNRIIKWPWQHSDKGCDRASTSPEFILCQIIIVIMDSLGVDVRCKGHTRDGPWPDPTRAYFWPAVNKGLTRVLSDPTQRDFFWPEGQKIEKFDIFRGNFPNSNPNHKWLTWPDPNFDPVPSLGHTIKIGSYVYGQCKFLLTQLRMPCWFYCNPWLTNCQHGMGFVRTTLFNLSSVRCLLPLSHMILLKIRNKWLR